MKAIMTVGVSGSGKSTIAKQLGYVQIERDIIRREMFNFKQWSEYKFTKEKENKVTAEHWNRIVDAAKNGQDIVISDTNLNKGRRKNMVSELEKLGFDVEILPCGVDVQYDDIIKRDASREFSVGQDTISKQWPQWIKFMKECGEYYHYQNDVTLPKCVIFDIDGTLAKMGDRGPFDWKRVGEDTPRDFIVMMANQFEQAGMKIIFLSGRDGSCFHETICWLSDNGLNGELFMRPKGNTDKDWKIKQEIFKKHVAENYNVVAVVDDRPQVVNMWHDIGIENVIAVADQRIKF